MLPREIRVLAERSMGSPMFLEELWRAHRAGAPLDALPDSVDSAVTAQIDHLSATDRQILRYAAVLGSTFTGRELIDLLQPELEGSEMGPSRAAPAGAGGVPQHRAVRPDPVPLGDRPRLRLRRAAVQAAEGAPRTGCQRPAGQDRGRQRGRAPLPPLLPRPALRAGLALRAGGRRPGQPEVRQRRSGHPLPTRSRRRSVGSPTSNRTRWRRPGRAWAMSASGPATTGVRHWPTDGHEDFWPRTRWPRPNCA